MRKVSYPGIGEFKVVSLYDRPASTFVCDTPEIAISYWQSNISNAAWFQAEKECMVALFVNTRRRITGHTLISLGTLDTCWTHPREVFRPAVVCAAAGFILMHNHPSGDPTPSEADIRVTRDLIRAGQLMKIEILDHIIVGAVSPERVKGHLSLRELGYFYSAT